MSKAQSRTTFNVWSEPDGYWKNGGKFTINVVQTRDEDEIPEDPEEEPDLTQFRFQRMQRTNKRKINKEFFYELQDIPEGEFEDTTERSNVDVEDDVALQAETRSGTSTGDSTNIGDPMMPKNPG